MLFRTRPRRERAASVQDDLHSNTRLAGRLADKLALLPTDPGCYVYHGSRDEVLYVGKAVNLRNRVRSYFQKGAQHSARIAHMVGCIRDMEWFVTDTEMEALILECNLIKKHKPPFNVRLRDDKSYPYVCVTEKDPYPRVFFTRRPHFTRDGNRYFGPYTDARALRDALRTLRRIFGVQSCRHSFTGQQRQRPCLYYHLGQCLGPCTGGVSQADYRKAVDEICLIFEGRHHSVLQRLNRQMAEAAENLQFERAAALRDRVLAIERFAEHQKVFSVDLVDQDIIGMARENTDCCVHVFFIRAGRMVGQDSFSLECGGDEPDEAVLSQFLKQYYAGAGRIPREILTSVEAEDRALIEQWLMDRQDPVRRNRVHIHAPVRGEKRRTVELSCRNAQIALEQRLRLGVASRESGEQACMEIAEALGLEMPPVRIECYDISNLQGGYAVGSMVVFEDGRPAKSEYRHFRIRTVQGQDDFASMKEVLGRRLARAAEGDERFSSLPDLMLIDGGKGQLGAALEALQHSGQEDVSLASLAKREEELYVPGRPDPIRLPRHCAGLRLVQHIRDEAHRFAITYHRKLRGKGSLVSALDGVPGIGQARRTKLMRHFGTLEAIRKASLEELASAPGMNRAVAAKLYEHLRSDDGPGERAA